MKQLKLTFFFLITITLQNCIQDDFINDTIEERISIDNPIDEIQLNDTFQLMATFFNNIGQVEQIGLVWTSSNSAVISISNTGLITALSLGNSTIRVEGTTNGGTNLFQEFTLAVTMYPVDNTLIKTKAGTISNDKFLYSDWRLYYF